MSDDKINIDKKIMDKLLKMANVETPESMDADSIKKAVLNTIGNQLDGKDDSIYSKNVLVVDDIGVVTYQLKVLLGNIGYNVTVTKDIYSAIEQFNNHEFGYIIMDLFVSTEQEGFTLLTKVKKTITQGNLNTKIIVITASQKSENKVKCLNGGADIFLRKEAGWQDKLLEVFQQD